MFATQKKLKFQLETAGWLGCDVEYAVADGSDQAGGNRFIASAKQLAERDLIQASDLAFTLAQDVFVIVPAACENEVGGGEFQQEGVAVDGDEVYEAPSAIRIDEGSEPELPSAQ